MAEFAPGIPRKDIKRDIPTLEHEYADFTNHLHIADRAGKHYDFRIRPKGTDVAYSWVLKKGIPPPGEMRKAIRQPDHTAHYMLFEGSIGSGYGKGKVRIDDSGPIRIVEANPQKIKLVLLNKKNPEELTMIRSKKDWLMINTTPTRTNRQDIPLEKDKYKNLPIGAVSSTIEDDSYALQPKMDGAHVIAEFSGAHPRVYSYRPSESSDKLIQHTFRMPGIDNIKIPKDLQGTIVRSELIIEDKDGNQLPPNEISGLLNSNVSRALQVSKLNDLKIKNYIFDVVKYKGEDYKNKPYKDKISAIQDIEKNIPSSYFKPMPTFIDKEEKKKLVSAIMENKYNKTREGFVAWKMDTPKAPIKIKIRPDYDVYVREIFPISVGPNKDNLAGGFSYSLDPTGPIIGNVGTGFSRELLQDMWKNKNKYIGAVAKVFAQGQYESGALRAPSFSEWHLDKGKQINKESNLIRDLSMIYYLEKIGYNIL